MRELRVSIPFVGGITAIYTPEEVAAKTEQVKAAAKQVVKSAVDTGWTLKVFGIEVARKVTASSLDRLSALDKYIQSIDTTK